MDECGNSDLLIKTEAESESNLNETKRNKIGSNPVKISNPILEFNLVFEKEKKKKEKKKMFCDFIYLYFGD